MKLLSLSFNLVLNTSEVVPWLGTLSIPVGPSRMEQHQQVGAHLSFSIHSLVSFLAGGSESRVDECKGTMFQQLLVCSHLLQGRAYSTQAPCIPLQPHIGIPHPKLG